MAQATQQSQRETSLRDKIWENVRELIFIDMSIEWLLMLCTKVAEVVLLLGIAYAGYKMTQHGSSNEELDRIWIISQVLALDLSAPGLFAMARQARERGEDRRASWAIAIAIMLIILSILSMVEGALTYFFKDFSQQILAYASFLMMIARCAAAVGYSVFCRLHKATHQQLPARQRDQITDLIETFRQELQRVEFQLPQVVQAGVHSQMTQTITQMQEIVHSEVQRVIHSQLQLVQSQMQEIVHSLPETVNHQIEEVVHSQVQPLIIEQVHRVVHLIENGAQAQSLHELAERVQAVSIQVSELARASREARMTTPTKAESEPSTASSMPGSCEPLRLVQSKAKKDRSELTDEPVESRVKRFILSKREGGSEPSLQEIVNQCNCSKNSAIRYRRELDAEARQWGNENSGTS